MTERRSTPKEVQEKIEQVLAMFRDGFKSMKDTKEMAIAHEWGLSERQVERYYHKARKQYLQEFFDFYPDLKTVKINNFIELLDIQRDSAIDKDFVLKLAIIKEKNKMFNVYEKDLFQTDEIKKTKKANASSIDELEERLLNEDI